jgi:hypothetical protein
MTTPVRLADGTRHRLCGDQASPVASKRRASRSAYQLGYRLGKPQPQRSADSARMDVAQRERASPEASVNFSWVLR